MKIQVGVFFGGRSVEHEVSVISAMQAVAALDTEKYAAIPVYITKEGLFYTGDGYGDIASYRDIPKLLAAGTRVTFVPDEGRALMLRYPGRKLKSNVLGHLDAALPVVHGTNVEDGILQGYLDTLGLPYAGPDVLSAAVCMDKAAAKTLLRAAGIPVLPGLVYSASEWSAGADALVAAAEENFGYPVVVKPVNLGSSVGISKASGPAELRWAADLAFRFAPRVLVEPAVVALREINCAVLGDEETARPSVCEEPQGQDEILSFDDKYLSGGKSQKGMGSAPRRIPADLTLDLQQTIQDLSVRAFQALGCRGVARVDFLLDTGKNSVYVNEVNTIPGSLAFYLWEPAGLSFTALLDELLALAFKRQRVLDTLTFTHETNILSGVRLGGKKNGG